MILQGLARAASLLQRKRLDVIQLGRYLGPVPEVLYALCIKTEVPLPSCLGMAPKILIP